MEELIEFYISHLNFDYKTVYYLFLYCTFIEGSLFNNDNIDSFH